MPLPKVTGWTVALTLASMGAGSAATWYGVQPVIRTMAEQAARAVVAEEIQGKLDKIDEKLDGINTRLARHEGLHNGQAAKGDS